MSKHEWHSLEDCPDYAEWSKGRRYARSQWTCRILPCDVKRHQYKLPYPKSGRGAHAIGPGTSGDLVFFSRRWPYGETQLIRVTENRYEVVAEVAPNVN